MSLLDPIMDLLRVQDAMAAQGDEQLPPNVKAADSIPASLSTLACPWARN